MGNPLQLKKKHHSNSIGSFHLENDVWVVACECQGHIDGFSTDKHGWGTQRVKFGFWKVFLPFLRLAFDTHLRTVHWNSEKQIQGDVGGYSKY